VSQAANARALVAAAERQLASLGHRDLRSTPLSALARGPSDVQKAALTLLHERHKDEAWRVARRWRAPDAEDREQASHVFALGAYSSFDASRGMELDAWVRVKVGRDARRVAKKKTEKERAGAEWEGALGRTTVVQDGEVDVLDAGENPEELVRRRGVEAAIDAFIASLPALERAIAEELYGDATNRLESRPCLAREHGVSVHGVDRARKNVSAGFVDLAHRLGMAKWLAAEARRAAGRAPVAQVVRLAPRDSAPDENARAA